MTEKLQALLDRVRYRRAAAFGRTDLLLDDIEDLLSDLIRSADIRRVAPDEATPDIARGEGADVLRQYFIDALDDIIGATSLGRAKEIATLAIIAAPNRAGGGE